MKIFVMIFCFLILVSCMKGKKVDQIFHNANIICMNDRNSSGEAIAIKNGKIVEIGPERQILNKYRADEITDIEGKEIVPTFSNIYFQLDSILTFEKLREFELTNLEQGITEVSINELNNSQLKQLISFIPAMQLTWYINLSLCKENIAYIRNYKKQKNKHFNIQGFSIGNEEINQVQEVLAIVKNKTLQIGVNFSKAKQNIPCIIQALKDYNQDHRWFVYNINDKNKTLLTQLAENNFFHCLNQSNKSTVPLYQFYSSNNKENLYIQLNVFCKSNNKDYTKSLKSISNWANYLSFNELKKGSLEKGKEANFTILETPLSTNSTRQNIYSNSTFILGKKIYSME